MGYDHSEDLLYDYKMDVLRPQPSKSGACNAVLTAADMQIPQSGRSKMFSSYSVPNDSYFASIPQTAFSQPYSSTSAIANSARSVLKPFQSEKQQENILYSTKSRMTSFSIDYNKSGREDRSLDV